MSFPIETTVIIVLIVSITGTPVGGTFLENLRVFAILTAFLDYLNLSISLMVLSTASAILAPVSRTSFTSFIVILITLFRLI